MVNYNGSLFKDGERILSSQNRAFRYGDGIFESIRVIDGKMPFLNLHFERLLRGMKALKMTIPTYMNIHYLRNEISKTIEEMPSSRVRLAIWREEGGFYTPTTNNIDFLIDSAPLPDRRFSFNDLGLRIGIFKDFKMQETVISAFKTSNSLPYIMAGLFAKENQLDDVVMLNTHGYITEGISSNIFILKDKKLITPSLSSGCVGGIMRFVVKEIADKNEVEIIEKCVSIDELSTADEVFYTNSIQGIRWVEQFEDITYPFDFSMQLCEKLNHKVQSLLHKN